MFFGKRRNSMNATAGGSTANNVTFGEATMPSAKVCLTKATEGLDRGIVRLQKTSGIDLSKHKARVFVVMDRSGSMEPCFSDGTVQRILTRFLPLALKFDDDGQLEVYVFNTVCEKMPAMNLHNYETYVKKQIIDKGFGPKGSTKYSPFINQIINDYNDNSPIPAFGIIITDGNPESLDKAPSDSAIRESSNHRIFLNFFGTGTSCNFEYLRKLDDLDGRAVDNTAFVKVSDFNKLNDDELYDKVLEQYPQWLRAMHIY